MAYETGTATDPSDLLNKLGIFCAANGWTRNRDTTVTGGRSLCLQKGTDMFFNLQSYVNASMVARGTTLTLQYAIAVNGSDQYDSAQATVHRMTGYSAFSSWTASTNQYVATMAGITGPYPTYHFFAFADSIHVELEYATGFFQRLGFGRLDTFSSGITTLGNGRYFYGTQSDGGAQWTSNLANYPESTSSSEMFPFSSWRSPNQTPWGGFSGSAVRAKFGTFDGWAPTATTSSSTYSSLVARSIGGSEPAFANLSPNPLNGVAVLSPIIVGISPGDVNFMPIGAIHGVRFCRIDNYLAGDEFTLGPDTWKVFPWSAKGQMSSKNRGIAILKA